MERMPNGSGYVSPTTNFYDGSGWASQLYSNVKSTGVFLCPDDSTALHPEPDDRRRSCSRFLRLQ